MMKRIWTYIERLVTLWGFIAILAIILDTVGVLPYYDIYYKKKSDITPNVFLYPGQNIRLSAEFSNVVSPQEIERVEWTLRDSSGKVYEDLPRLREIDVALMPDFVGTVSMSVRAKLSGEESERRGVGNIHVMQTAPHQLSFLKRGTFLLPQRLEKADLAGIQLYVGSAKWSPAIADLGEPDRLRLAAEGSQFPVWNDKAYVRYRSDTGFGEYRYEAISMLQATKTGSENN